MALVTGSASSSSQTIQTPAATSAYGASYPLGPITFRANFGNGATADLVQLQYINTLSLAAAAQTLDLTSLLDPLGGAVNFARVRRLRVRPRTTTDGQTLVLSGGATTPWTAFLNSAGTLTLQPSSSLNDGWFELVGPNTTGYAVAGGSKTLKFDPGASTFLCDVEMFGA